MNQTEEKLTTARVGLLLKAPFFGNMATRMKLIDASEWCPTAATDGRNFFYNKDFVEKLSTKKLEFLFGHEIGHCVFDHFGRAGSRDRQLCNIAQDYAINIILKDEKIGDVIDEVKICLDPKYRGLAWEEIYDSLYEEADKIGMDELLEQLGDLLDDHINGDTGSDSPEAQGAGNGKDKKGKPILTKEDKQKIKDEIKEAMIQSAAAAGAGKTPGAIQRLIKDLTEPKMNWREILRMNIQSLVRNDYSFTRPSRKGWASGVILPGLVNDETIDVAVCIDMSGSIGMDDATVFLTEIKGIMDQYEDYNVKIWCFDTEVYNYAEFSADAGDGIETYEPKGGGGTEFMVNWDFMKENGIEPKKLIMFTDGYPWGSWGDENYCDTLFVVKGNTTAESPFGQTVIYEKDAELRG
jgi:predicted metal-dependent peptidase|tara:strand:+ start:5978 stop:7204 length:1227 start_codon:yes stop_codon:yes gene_type:complete